MTRPPPRTGSLAWAAGLAAAGLLAAGGCPRGNRPPRPSELARIPAGAVRLGSVETEGRHPPREVAMDAFRLGRKPVTVREFARYLNERGAVPPPRFPDLWRFGGWRPLPFRGGRPARGMTRDEARAYCEWLSLRIGEPVRLPTAEEWETAARGGVAGARYPWGWGDPRGRARFASRRPVRSGRYPPNPYGLYDMAGNVFQWCCDSPGPGLAIACGGAWSEPEPGRLRVFERTRFPDTYRGGDVGFRIRLPAPGATGPKPEARRSD